MSYLFNAEYLSFQLGWDFLQEYKDKKPNWGFQAGAGNSLGEYSWISKYARRKDDGTRERFWEGLARVINGMYSIQKDHCSQYRLPWDERKAQESAEEAYMRAFAGKWSPPGRGLWMMGTELVNGKGDSSALQNCAMVSTEPFNGDAILPYVRIMDMSMMGVGVGFDTKGAGKVEVHEPGQPFPHQIADSREGWVKSVAALLRAFFTGARMPNFDYSQIRPAGAPIKGFGGIAAGPDPLRKGHETIVKLLSGRQGQVLTSTDVVDIANVIGKLVVSGNVRRSAQIALGDIDDRDFLKLKDWELNAERMGADGWGHLSNNSVIAHSGDDLSHVADAIRMNGEPGVIWLDMCRDYGRVSDGKDGKDWRVAGINPCAEQPLENMECCTLVETYPTNHSDYLDYQRTLKFAYLYGKTVTLLPTRWPETNAVMQRNRRIGLSMTGLAQFAEHQGTQELTMWQDNAYEHIRMRDAQYSEWLGVRESIRVTTIKPSGTVSLLYGVTPGVHWPVASGYYIRTVREAKGSAVARAFEAAGYLVEPSIMDPDSTVVITLPVQTPPMRSQNDVSVWEKVSLAASCQRWWSDNAVSVTATFRPDESNQIPAVLRAFDGQLKSLSFLPADTATYPQMPYQMCSLEYWESLRDNIMPIDWEGLYNDESLPDAEGERYCTTDVCEIKR